MLVVRRDLLHILTLSLLIKSLEFRLPLLLVWFGIYRRFSAEQFHFRTIFCLVLLGIWDKYFVALLNIDTSETGGAKN